MGTALTNGKKLYGTVFNIEHFHVHDGTGIRTNVFLKGCHLRCPWCCNPESQNMKAEIAVHKNLCTNCGLCVNECPNNAITFEDNVLSLNKDLCDKCGLCVEKCLNNARQLYGKKMSVEEVVKEIEKDEVFFRKSGGGVTVSGGEPSLQPEFTRAILLECKKRYINTAVETCGAIKWDDFWKTVEYADEILFDIKFTEPDLFDKISPVPLTVVKDNIAKLKERNKNVIFRYPIIPGFNDNNEHINNIIEWAKQMKIERIDILPFHQLGKHKYDSLDKEYDLDTLQPPSDDWINEVVKKISDSGFEVTIGG